MLCQTLGRMKAFSRIDHSIDCMSQRGKKHKNAILITYFSYVIFLYSGNLEVYENGEAKEKHVVWRSLKLQDLKTGVCKSKLITTKPKKTTLNFGDCYNCTFLPDIHLKLLSGEQNLQDSFLTIFLIASVFREAGDNRKTVRIDVILTLASKCWLEYRGLIPELT